MTEILFIKTSSLGDVIHHMPAVTESRAHFPKARISWLVEEAYAPLARLHPAVDEVIAVAWRRWRKELLTPQMWRELGAWRRRIAAQPFDEAIDTQGLIRTALMSRFARGRRHGYDSASIREPLASRFYDVRHQVSRQLHAVERNRRLTGLALGYQPNGPADYGIDRSALRSGGAPYALLLHGTARPEKEWPVQNWVALGNMITRRGVSLVVPWGNDVERARAAQIADAVSNARAAEPQSVEGMTRLVAGAEFVVGVDTGFVHLAAAFGVPLVAIFSGTDPALSRPVGSGPMEVVGAKGTTPSVESVAGALNEILH
jgi:heptosyltransferase-1